MSDDLSLLPSELGEDLRGTVREVLADRCDPAAVVAMGDGDDGVLEPLWRSVAVDLGLAGLLVPESLGGHGVTAREAAVVCEELGAAAAPVPFLTSSVLATSVLLAGGAPSQAAGDLLGRLAAGEVTAALVVPWTTSPWAEVPALSESGGDVRSVAGVVEADVLLVPVATGDGVEVRAVEVSSAGVTLERVVALDMSRPLADVTVDLDADAGEVVVAAAEGAAGVSAALRVAAGMLASEQAGVARAALTRTVGYLQERHQFGRVVGGFQALKHRLADVYVEAEGASASAAWAAAALADLEGGDEEVALAVAVAGAACAESAVHAAEEMVQLHGGIAMTWEHPAHLLLKRAKADELALGTPEAYRTVVASLADLPPG